MSPYDLRQKIAELRREMKMRESVYPGLVQRGSMKIEDARTQIAILASIIADYQQMLDEHEPKLL
jgi:hypothetical protein